MPVYHQLQCATRSYHKMFKLPQLSQSFALSPPRAVYQLEVNVIIDLTLGDHLSVLFALHKQHTNTSSCKTPSDTRVILHAWLCNLLHFVFFMDCDSGGALFCPLTNAKNVSEHRVIGQRLSVSRRGLFRVSCDFDPVLCELLCHLEKEKNTSDVFMKKSIIFQLTWRIELFKQGTQ